MIIATSIGSVYPWTCKGQGRTYANSEFPSVVSRFACGLTGGKAPRRQRSRPMRCIGSGSASRLPEPITAKPSAAWMARRSFCTPHRNRPPKWGGSARLSEGSGLPRSTCPANRRLALAFRLATCRRAKCQPRGCKAPVGVSGRYPLSGPCPSRSDLSA